MNGTLDWITDSLCAVYAAREATSEEVVTVMFWNATFIERKELSPSHPSIFRNQGRELRIGLKKVF